MNSLQKQEQQGGQISLELIPPDRLPRTREKAVETLLHYPEQYWISLNPKSFEDVFEAQDMHSLTIKGIETELGEARIRAFMVIWLNSLIDFYSTNGTMDAYQIVDTIDLIREEYLHYTQEDFKLFFKQVKKGYFDAVYGRIDGDVIMRWLQKYDSSRTLAAERISIKESERYKEFTDSEYFLSGVSYEEYLEVKKRAESGDQEAINELKPPHERD